MFMSMSVGPFCDLAQDVDSKDWTQGAVVSLVMDENERECKYLSNVMISQGYTFLKPGGRRVLEIERISRERVCEMIFSVREFL